MKKIALLAMTSVLSVGSIASAKSMSCLIGVYKVENLVAEDQATQEKSMALAKISLKDDEGEKELVVNGEKVTIMLYKKMYADVYDMNVLLTTPEADRMPRTRFVTGIHDFLVNEGPAKRNPYIPDVKEGTLEFGYLLNQSGALSITPKIRKAMEARGMWGKHPFTSPSMNVAYSHNLAEAVKELVAKGDLKSSDVAALTTVFNCALNK